MTLRHRSPGVDPPRDARDPQWATALVLGALAIATLAITRTPTDVPVVVGAVLVALGLPARLP